ncbi:PilN domain-containing protein [bacterium]|nr:PilN domain-containing protein [bacterium]
MNFSGICRCPTDRNPAVAGQLIKAFHPLRCFYPLGKIVSTILPLNYFAFSTMIRSTGLDLGNDAVKVVVLQKFFNRLRLVKFGEEKFVSPKPADEEIIAAIRRLFERLRIKNRNVVIHFGGVGVRYLVLEGPLLSASELLEWIRHYCAERLPKTANVAQLIFSYHVLQQTENSQKLMVCYCQPHILQEKLQWVEAAGLQPVMVGAGELDLFHAFAFGAEDVFSKNLLFIDQRIHTTALLVTANGNPVLYREFATSTFAMLKSEIQKVLSSWQADDQKPIDKIILVGDSAAPETVQAMLPAEITVTVGQPLLGLLRDGQILAPKYSLAAGLALKPYFPALNAIDLLLAEKRSRLKQQQEKRRALRLILAGGVLTLLCLVGLNVLKLILTNKLAASEEQIFALASQLAAHAKLQKEQLQLQQALADVQLLVTQRSQYAPLLEEVSRVMPEGVWLHELAIASNDSLAESGKNTRRNQVQLRGWAFDEGKVAALLAQLENSPQVSQVRLLSTTRLAADEVWQRSRLRKMPLVEFMIASVTKQN